MRSTILAAVLLFLALPASSQAQQPEQKPAMPDSATMAQMAGRMAGMFNQMGPMYETMTQAMLDGSLKALERPETVDRLARFARRYYEALIRQGFTREEALQIVAGAGIPGTQPTR